MPGYFVVVVVFVTNPDASDGLYMVKILKSDHPQRSRIIKIVYC